jgi:23S rRNA pseudouridine1911/1915/1917 synthase
MSTEKIELIIPDESDGSRVDLFLASAIEAGYSRSFIQKCARAGLISVNGNPIKPNYRLRRDDRLLFTIPEPEKIGVEPRDIPLDILYEDGDIVVINKRPGITVHPGTGTHGDTLVSALLFHIDDLSSIGGVERPGIVHRLDKDTSGIMVVAKNDRAHRNLSEQFAARTTGKEYIAVVAGHPISDHFVIDKPIGRHPVYRHKMTITDQGRESKTEVEVRRRYTVSFGRFSLLRIILHTGRTHQIRVHLSSAGFPIVGDGLYSKKRDTHNVPFILLASVHLSFDHPADGRRLSFNIDPPDHIKQFIDKLESSQ